MESLDYVDSASDTEKDNFKVGDTVIVESRTWPGMNKLGGAGRISTIDASDLFTVRYLLGGSERRVHSKYIKPYTIHSEGQSARHRKSRKFYHDEFAYERLPMQVMDSSNLVHARNIHNKDGRTEIDKENRHLEKHAASHNSCNKGRTKGNKEPALLDTDEISSMSTSRTVEILMDHKRKNTRRIDDSYLVDSDSSDSKSSDTIQEMVSNRTSKRSYSDRKRVRRRKDRTQSNNKKVYVGGYLHSTTDEDGRFIQPERNAYELPQELGKYTFAKTAHGLKTQLQESQQAFKEQSTIIHRKLTALSLNFQSVDPDADNAISILKNLHEKLTILFQEHNQQLVWSGIDVMNVIITKFEAHGKTLDVATDIKNDELVQLEGEIASRIRNMLQGVHAELVVRGIAQDSEADSNASSSVFSQSDMEYFSEHGEAFVEPQSVNYASDESEIVSYPLVSDVFQSKKKNAKRRYLRRKDDKLNNASSKIAKNKSRQRMNNTYSIGGVSSRKIRETSLLRDALHEPRIDLPKKEDPIETINVSDDNNEQSNPSAFDVLAESSDWNWSSVGNKRVAFAPSSKTQNFIKMPEKNKTDLNKVEEINIASEDKLHNASVDAFQFLSFVATQGVQLQDLVDTQTLGISVLKVNTHSLEEQCKVFNILPHSYADQVHVPHERRFEHLFYSLMFKYEQLFDCAINHYDDRDACRTAIERKMEVECHELLVALMHCSITRVNETESWNRTELLAAIGHYMQQCFCRLFTISEMKDRANHVVLPGSTPSPFLTSHCRIYWYFLQLSISLHVQITWNGNKCSDLTPSGSSPSSIQPESIARNVILLLLDLAVNVPNSMEMKCNGCNVSVVQSIWNMVSRVLEYNVKIYKDTIDQDHTKPRNIWQLLTEECCKLKRLCECHFAEQVVNGYESLRSNEELTMNRKKEKSMIFGKILCIELMWKTILVVMSFVASTSGLFGLSLNLIENDVWSPFSSLNVSNSSLSTQEVQRNVSFAKQVCYRIRMLLKLDNTLQRNNPDASFQQKVQLCMYVITGLVRISSVHVNSFKFLMIGRCDCETSPLQCNSDGVSHSCHSYHEFCQCSMPYYCACRLPSELIHMVKSLKTLPSKESTRTNESLNTDAFLLLSELYEGLSFLKAKQFHAKLMQQIHLTIPKDCEQAVWNWSSNLKVSTKDETVSAAKLCLLASIIAISTTWLVKKYLSNETYAVNMAKKCNTDIKHARIMLLNMVCILPKENSGPSIRPVSLVLNYICHALWVLQRVSLSSISTLSITDVLKYKLYAGKFNELNSILGFVNKSLEHIKSTTSVEVIPLLRKYLYDDFVFGNINLVLDIARFTLSIVADDLNNCAQTSVDSLNVLTNEFSVCLEFCTIFHESSVATKVVLQALNIVKRLMPDRKTAIALHPKEIPSSQEFDDPEMLDIMANVVLPCDVAWNALKMQYRQKFADAAQSHVWYPLKRLVSTKQSWNDYDSIKTELIGSLLALFSEYYDHYWPTIVDHFAIHHDRRATLHSQTCARILLASFKYGGVIFYSSMSTAIKRLNRNLTVDELCLNAWLSILFEPTVLSESTYSFWLEYTELMCTIFDEKRSPLLEIVSTEFLGCVPRNYKPAAFALHQKSFALYEVAAHFCMHVRAKLDRCEDKRLLFDYKRKILHGKHSIFAIALESIHFAFRKISEALESLPLDVTSLLNSFLQQGSNSRSRDDYHNLDSYKFVSCLKLGNMNHLRHVIMYVKLVYDVLGIILETFGSMARQNTVFDRLLKEFFPSASFAQHTQAAADLSSGITIGECERKSHQQLMAAQYETMLTEPPQEFRSDSIIMTIRSFWEVQKYPELLRWCAQAANVYQMFSDSYWPTSTLRILLLNVLDPDGVLGTACYYPRSESARRQHVVHLIACGFRCVQTCESCELDVISQRREGCLRRQLNDMLRFFLKTAVVKLLLNSVDAVPILQVVNGILAHGSQQVLGLDRKVQPLDFVAIFNFLSEMVLVKLECFDIRTSAEWCILHHQMFSICRRVLLLKGDLFGIALECCKLAILRGLFITNVVFWTSQKSMLEVLGSCWQATRISSLDVELCDTLLSLPVVDKAFYSEARMDLLASISELLDEARRHPATSHIVSLCES